MGISTFGGGRFKGVHLQLSILCQRGRFEAAEFDFVPAEVGLRRGRLDLEVAELDLEAMTRGGVARGSNMRGSGGGGACGLLPCHVAVEFVAFALVVAAVALLAAPAPRHRCHVQGCHPQH
jgi:hypothetical protein